MDSLNLRRFLRYAEYGLLVLIIVIEGMVLVLGVFLPMWSLGQQAL